MSGNLVQLLAGCDFFRGLDEAVLAELAAQSNLREYGPGQTILEVGQPAGELLVVVSGSVSLGLRVTRGSDSRFINLKTIGPGQGVGWSALVPPHRVTLTVQAREQAELACLDAEWLRARVEQDLRLQARLYQNLAQLVGTRVAVLQALLASEAQRWLDSQS